MLTGSQEMFAAGVAQGLSQAQAYRNAYPASAKWKDATVWKRASELANQGEVSGRVHELLKQAAANNEVTVDRVVKELARLAFFDIRKLVNADGTPLPLHNLDDDTAAAIAGLDVARVGNAMIGEAEVLKFKIADKKGALELLGRHLGLFEKDNQQQAPVVFSKIELVGVRPKPEQDKG